MKDLISQNNLFKRRRQHVACLSISVENLRPHDKSDLFLVDGSLLNSCSPGVTACRQNLARLT
eukprot:747564-Hanusia_phi.AAC.2